MVLGICREYVLCFVGRNSGSKCVGEIVDEVADRNGEYEG